MYNPGGNERRHKATEKQRGITVETRAHTRGHEEHPYASKPESLGKMNKFLEKSHENRLETENRNTPVTI